ncbi:hypothetical protein DJ018_14170 [Phenylobacterium deserti]|uniref:Flagellar protein FlaG n=1 Tax=Phenylobacterium deserti TaxID=1914756 RepID=A0A328ABV7_9CAUL|nr:hypothetical protein DJ018_14170 [Phenylobacterium deserti]
MESKVAPFAATTDSPFSQNPPPRKAPRSRTRRAEVQNEEQADLRLIIEEDEAAGTLVYKTINRRTGEVVLQMPREEIEKLGEETEYVAGSVIRAKA